MATTPPPPSLSRARTPPTPLHGARFDDYEPYSPRRSKRTTAQASPYSSFSSTRAFQANVTPPPTIRKTRPSRQQTHLSSPPTSPSSPIRTMRLQKTPHRTPTSVRKPSTAEKESTVTGVSLLGHNIDASSMLPTPSKTPRKRNAAGLQSTARILNFHPEDPNDVMPTPRKIKHSNRITSPDRLDVYEDLVGQQSPTIQIFTDTNARIPEIDHAEANPFVGPKQRSTPRRGRRRETVHDQRMSEAVRNDEGVTYVFRGKRIFRPFASTDEELSSQGSETDRGHRLEQRNLRRMAGATADRPLTRSALKPRLLFPTAEDIAARERALNDVDEEALTDLDPVVATAARIRRTTQARKSPNRVRFARNAPSLAPLSEDVEDTALIPTNDTPLTPSVESPSEALLTPSLRKRQSPFDEWPRTKIGRKRSEDSLQAVAGSTKRAKPSPAN